MYIYVGTYVLTNVYTYIYMYVGTYVLTQRRYMRNEMLVTKETFSKKNLCL
jgi:hypothetical protein